MYTYFNAYAASFRATYLQLIERTQGKTFAGSNINIAVPKALCIQLRERKGNASRRQSTPAAAASTETVASCAPKTSPTSLHTGAITHVYTFELRLAALDL